MMKWFRWYHDTLNDPKWRLVAALSGQSIGNVMAVWIAVLECASKAKERGVLESWNDALTGVMTGMTGDDVAAVRKAMQGIVLDGDRVAAWDKRQTARPDDQSTDRVRAHRERKAAEQADQARGNAHETQRNAPETPIESDGEVDSEERTLDVSVLQRSPDTLSAPTPTKAPKPRKPTVTQADVDYAVMDWNKLAKAFPVPAVMKLTDKRERMLKARLVEMGGTEACQAKWTEFLDCLEASDWHMGRNERGWTADFDWAIAPGNWVKIIERASAKRPAPKRLVRVT